MTLEIFNKLTSKAIDEIPDEFREKLDNVEIIVEDFPTTEIIDSVGLSSKWDLLGLYVGVPITHKSVFTTQILPTNLPLQKTHFAGRRVPQ